MDDQKVSDLAPTMCPECEETTVPVPCYECKFGTCMACGYPCACPDVEEAYATAKGESDFAADLPDYHQECAPE